MEVLFELKQIGSITKVTAVDPETGTEVVIQGPSSLHQSTLQKQAMAKLRYVLNKQKDAETKKGG